MDFELFWVLDIEPSYGTAGPTFVYSTRLNGKILFFYFRDLEKKIAKFHGRDDAILYAAAFDANAGIFEVLLGKLYLNYASHNYG